MSHIFPKTDFGSYRPMPAALLADKVMPGVESLEQFADGGEVVVTVEGTR